jgi:hypothetical protein
LPLHTLKLVSSPNPLPVFVRIGIFDARSFSHEQRNDRGLITYALSSAASNELCRSPTAIHRTIATDRRRCAGRADRSPVVEDTDHKSVSNSNNFTSSLALKGQLGHYLSKSKLASDREG